MPDLSKAFPTQMGSLFSGEHPPVDRARELVDELYFDEVCTIITRDPVRDPRGGYKYTEQVRRDIPCHITKVSNQRGAFTQGGTSSGGNGPLTSASLWYAFFPMGTGVDIADILELDNGARLSVIGSADEATWKVMEAFRCTQLGIDQ